ncbi:EF-P lysine aminoacylase GenX [Candidatus Gottesmanbacteria bacterium RBG_13_37_7]|uniref:EF-P lysine aminoacylase GenX n=1 Tax=Candidatus Gottesmanbacteria bacterium RBG_13_37_7 TaxID=1798369 RepID=A0A1F5YIZ3_9BACT|nr:MAG: EF-P lysine aminoacylase GenX [Candidatus Gottesmanbacteria bacterium RBG_13_37_7]
MQNQEKIHHKKSLPRSFYIREIVLQSIRSFFLDRNFHEVETPILLPSLIPESYLDVFETKLYDRRKKSKKLYLSTSPEASIKKLLSAGLGNCFEITKSFRNSETTSRYHNCEFTILEWYRVNADYRQIMKDCEKLLLHILKNIDDKLKSKNIEYKAKKITYQNHIIDISSPWKKISMKQALEKYCQISFDHITDNRFSKYTRLFNPYKIRKVAQSKGYNVSATNSWEEIFNQIFLNEIEPHLAQETKPVILYDYPSPMAALAKIKKNDPRFAERFEIYIAGLEIGDGCNELTNYWEQKKRFSAEMRLIKQKGKTARNMDQDFLKAMKIGLPDCTGIAVGVDRLVMLLSNAKTIGDILLFPQTDLFGV